MEGRRAGGRRRGEARRRCGRRYAGEEDGAGEEDDGADGGTRPPLPEMAGQHQPATSGRPRRGGPSRGELPGRGAAGEGGGRGGRSRGRGRQRAGALAHTGARARLVGGGDSPTRARQRRGWACGDV